MLANLGENELNSSQDPDMVDVIMGLITQDEEFNNPFQVVENIKREMVRQAEVSGGRAMDWSLNSFDQVGGYNTLRSVWAKLIDDRRVKGKKRAAEDNDSYSNVCENSPKKTKVSLNVSSACERLESILLQDGEAGNSMNVSVGDNVFERVEDGETSNEWDIITNETCRKSSKYQK